MGRNRITIDGDLIQFDWADGSQDRIDVSKFDHGIKRAAMLYGFKQKLTDAYALPTRSDENGRVYRPTVSEKRESFHRVLRAMLDGAWAIERGEGEGSLLLRAMRAVYGDKPQFEDSKAFETWLGDKAAQQGVSPAAVRRTLTRVPKIAEAIESLRPGSAADADEILSDL